MKYTVLNATKANDTCPEGRYHISAARITSDPGVLMFAPMDKLLGMQQDTFVTPDPDNVHQDISLTFEPCSCGSGYVLVPDGVVKLFNN